MMHLPKFTILALVLCIQIVALGAVCEKKKWGSETACIKLHQPGAYTGEHCPWESGLWCSSGGVQNSAMKIGCAHCEYLCDDMDPQALIALYRSRLNSPVENVKEGFLYVICCIRHQCGIDFPKVGYEESAVECEKEMGALQDAKQDSWPGGDSAWPNSGYPNQSSVQRLFDASDHDIKYSNNCILMFIAIGTSVAIATVTLRTKVLRQPIINFGDELE